MQKEVKICSPQLGISPHSNLGGEVADREELKALAKIGARVFIYLPPKKPYERKISNWSISFVSITHIFPPIIFNFFLLSYLFRTYSQEKFDILRVHNHFFVGLGAVVFRFFHSEVPLALRYHHLEEGNVFYQWLERILLPHFDLITTPSISTKQELLRKYNNLNPEKIVAIANGVDIKYEPKPKNASLVKRFNLQGKHTLVFLGYLIRRKNVSFLIRLMCHFRHRPVVLLIGGEGPEKAKLVRLIKKFNLENQVLLAGFVPENEKVDFYNLADIFVFPTKKEGFGLAVAEAMACEKPVVVSNNSSLPEIVTNGQDGFLVETNNIEKWVKALEILIKDKDLRQQMGRAGRKKILKKFSWEKSAQETLKIFKKLLIW